MMFSPDPLTERLALMWHNHFATSNRKVNDLSLMRQQNEIFRCYARAPFGELLVAAVKHPAMLVWLDADSNRAGKPNENLGRELLELFTLGIGNYDEDDVKAAARALTGWTVAEQTFRFAAARHDGGEIALLGTQGRLSGDDLLNLLPQCPATARRIAWRLCTVFFGEGVVDEHSLAELAEGLSERELDLHWAVETIVRSQLFFSSPNMRTRILAPIEFLIGAVHALGLQKPAPSTLLLAEWAGRMGQELFYPPNVGGWPEGQAWLGSKSVIARANFAAALVDGLLWNPSSPPDLSHCLPADRLSGDPASSVRALAELMWGAAAANALEPAQRTVAAKPRDEQLRAAIYALLTSPEAHVG